MIYKQKKSFIKAYVLHHLFIAEISHFLEYIKLFDKYASLSDKQRLFINDANHFDAIAGTAEFSDIVKRYDQRLKRSPTAFCKAFFNVTNFIPAERLIIEYSRHADCSVAFQNYVKYFFVH